MEIFTETDNGGCPLMTAERFVEFQFILSFGLFVEDEYAGTFLVIFCKVSSLDNVDTHEFQKVPRYSITIKIDHIVFMDTTPLYSLV